MPRNDDTEEGPSVLVGKARDCAVQLSLHKNRQNKVPLPSPPPPTPTGECKKARLPGVSAASCASFLFSNVELPSDYRPPGEAASCWVCQEGPSKREGKRHLSRPRQGHTWAPQAVGPGQRPAPASLGGLPTHCGGRQLGWSPAQLCGRKTFVLGVWPRLVPPRRAGSLCSEDKH